MPTNMRTTVRPPELRVIDEAAPAQTWYDMRREYVDALITKWAWLLEGTKKQKLTPIPERLYPAMAILFENQQALCRGVVTEATLTTAIAMPETFALPIIRRVYPQLIINKIASIQPMPASSGGVARIFFLDFYREDVTPNTNLTESDYDYTVGEENSVPPRVRMAVTDDTITAVKDILGATWSTEVMEDARGTLGLDVEGELLSQAAGEILRELEQRVVYDILNLASAGNVNWSPTVPADHTTKQWYETLMFSLLDADALIQQWRYRHADWIIAGPTAASYIRKCTDWKSDPRNQEMDQPFGVGVEKIGEVVGFWDVYQSFYVTSNMALMGIYPRSQLDTGYIYAPYVPLEMMPLVYAEYEGPSDTNPGMYKNTDKWSRNIRTRYGKKMVVPRMFATITITE